MPNNPLHCCRVCGLDHEYFIWGQDGKSPTFDICECCGVEFGYGDTSVQNCIDIRKHWIEVENAKWRDHKLKPEGWNLEQQLRQIPNKFQGPDDLKLYAQLKEKNQKDL